MTEHGLFDLQHGNDGIYLEGHGCFVKIPVQPREEYTEKWGPTIMEIPACVGADGGCPLSIEPHYHFVSDDQKGYSPDWGVVTDCDSQEFLDDVNKAFGTEFSLDQF